MSAVLCPRCRAEVDVAAFAPGSTVRCSECGGMLRVPTGRTGLHPAVQPPAPVEERKSTTKVRAPSEGRSITRTRMRLGGGSETRLRRLPARSSNNGLLVGLLIGAGLIIVGLVFVLASGRTSPSPAPPPLVQRPPVLPPPPPPLPAPAPPASTAALDPAAEADSSGPSFRGGDPAKANWDQIMQMLRPGGGFDDPGRPEGAAFMKVKAMGKDAYPYLIGYIDHQDVLLGRAAVVVLNELTGRNAPARPTDVTKAQIKADWEGWLKANP